MYHIVPYREIKKKKKIQKKKKNIPKLLALFQKPKSCFCQDILKTFALQIYYSFTCGTSRHLASIMSGLPQVKSHVSVFSDNVKLTEHNFICLHWFSTETMTCEPLDLRKLPGSFSYDMELPLGSTWAVQSGTKKMSVFDTISLPFFGQIDKVTFCRYPER